MCVDGQDLDAGEMCSWSRYPEQSLDSASVALFAQIEHAYSFVISNVIRRMCPSFPLSAFQMGHRSARDVFHVTVVDLIRVGSNELTFVRLPRCPSVLRIETSFASCPPIVLSHMAWKKTDT